MAMHEVCILVLRRFLPVIFGGKPGDPIGLGGIIPAVKPEEQRPSVPIPVGVQPMVPRAQEPIQVAAVNLDIISSSSDEYSSDVGSSDEDDED